MRKFKDTGIMTFVFAPKYYLNAKPAFLTAVPRPSCPGSESACANVFSAPAWEQDGTGGFRLRKSR